MDLDADARLSKQEFIEGLKPEEPYSKLLKRSEVKKSDKKTKNSCMLGKCFKKLDQGGLSLVLDDNQKDEVRTFAMDREVSKGKK